MIYIPFASKALDVKCTLLLPISAAICDVIAEMEKLYLEECRVFVLGKARFGVCSESNSMNIYHSDSKSYGHPWPYFSENKNHSW